MIRSQFRRQLWPIEGWISFHFDSNSARFISACSAGGAWSIYWLALDLEISFVQIGWVRSVVMLLAILPLSFSGLGIREGTLVFLLQGYGVQPAEALALSFLIFFRDILLALTGGLLELLRNFFRKPLPQTIIQGKQLDKSFSN